MEIPIQRIAVLLLAQLTNKLSKVIRNKAVVIGKVLRAELWNFPAGDIAVHTIKKRRICAHLRGERVKQAAGFQQHIHALVDIAHKHHRGRGCLFLLTTSEGTRCHIVLHDLDAIFILETDSGDLIKGHAIPQPDQAHCLAAHVVKQVRNGGLPARHQNSVGRNFLVEMGFSGAAGSQLAEIKVVFHQRQHTR
ncbi:hypothetical protein SDC9_145521 [bioreactor metagenome]|uniref:Uncharacterized protein n=1 Tax=bioreactor metagenome TaxID=1076179 RepID=A0A645E9P6_9ZZZZ